MSDFEIRRYIYERVIAGEHIPRVAEVAAALRLPVEATVASLRRMHDAHVLVVDAAGEIIMANPFSAVPTAFEVRSGAQSWFGNCIWDALGILAMLKTNGEVRTACPDCSEPMTLAIRNGSLDSNSAIVHIALPVKKWWENVVFT